MAISNFECPNCGAQVQPGLSQTFVCESCGSNLISDNSGFRETRDSKQVKKFSFTELENGLLKVQIQTKVNSISEIIGLLTREDVQPKDVFELIASNNTILKLDGIEEFQNLQSLILNNNKIEFIEPEVTNFFIDRAYKSKTFTLNVTGNDNIDYHFMNDLEIENDLPKKFWQYIHIPEIEKEVYTLKSQSKEANRKWERSEHSVELKRKYKTYDEFQSSETRIPTLESTVFQKIDGILQSKQLLRNTFTLHIDKSPFEFGLKDYFEVNDNTFYRYIYYPMNEKALVEALSQITGYDFKSLIEKQKKFIRIEDKKGVFASISLPVGLGIGGLLLGGCIGMFRGCGLIDYDENHPGDAYLYTFKYIKIYALKGALIAAIIGLLLFLLNYWNYSKSKRE